MGAQLEVLVSERMAPSIRSLAADYPDFTFTTVPMDGPVKDEYLTSDILWMSAVSDEIFDAILDKNTNLKWIQLTAAGFDWILRDRLTERIDEGVHVTRSAHSFDVPIAEFVIASMFSSARKFPEMAIAQQRKEWTRPEAREIGGSKVLVLGTGAIGGEVAWRCRALGATVTGVSRSGEPTQHFDEVVPVEKLHDVLPGTDYLVIAVPLTSETKELIGAAELQLLPRHSTLINVGRGAVVRNEDLIAALKQGTIASATVDVFEEEPLPASSELWEVPNLFVTPHSSFRAVNNLVRLEQDFRSNLERFLANVPLKDKMRVPELGY